MDENEILRFLKKVENKAAFTTRYTTDEERQAIRDCLTNGYIRQIKNNFYEITQDGKDHLDLPKSQFVLYTKKYAIPAIVKIWKIVAAIFVFALGCYLSSGNHFDNFIIWVMSFTK